MREDKDLTDVTLLCEDGKQVEAHKQHPGGNAEDERDKVANAPMRAENFRERKKIEANVSGQASTKPVDIVAISNTPISADPADLDRQIKSMMTLANVLSNHGQNRLAICNICGKEGPANNKRSHMEANQITGVSHSCNICGKTSRSRDALRKHKHNYHNALLQDQTRLEEAQV